MKNCEICGESFTRADNYKRHVLTYHTKPNDNRPKCSECETWLKSNTFLEKHLLKVHNIKPQQKPKPKPKQKTKQNPKQSNDNPQPSTSALSSGDRPPLKRKSEVIDPVKPKKARITMKHCSTCNLDIQKSVYSAHLRTNKHKENSSVMYKSNNIHITRCAFKKRIQTFKIVNLKKEELIFDEFFKEIKSSIKTLIEEHIKIHTLLKVNVELFGLYQLVKEDEIDSEIKSFNTKNETISQSSDLENIIQTWFNIITTKSEEFYEQNSGWSLLEILHLEININKSEPMKASGFTKLPKCISKKNAVVNVLSDDGRCFAYSIMSALFPTELNINYIYEYPDYRDHLNFNGIDLPMEFSNITKFEEQNDFSINVFGLNQSNTKVIGPLHHTKHRKLIHINLLYYVYRNKKHFVWIKDLSRLVGSQLSKHKARKFICDGCLLYFSSEQKLQNHQKDSCHKIKVTIPPEGKWKLFLVFTNVNSNENVFF